MKATQTVQTRASRPGRTIRSLLSLAALTLLGLQANAQTAAGNSTPSARPTPPEHKTVVVLGDSLAAGYGLDPSQAFPALVQKLIDERRWRFTVVNAAVSGDTSAGGLRRIDWLLKRRVDVLLLELGGNDGLRGVPVALTRSNLQAIIDRTRGKHPQARIVIAAMQMPPNMGQDYAEPFERLFPELARANNAALIPFLLEGVGGKPEFNLPDRIHPTAEGHRRVAQTVWKTLKPVLEAMNSSPSGSALGQAQP